MPSPEVPSSRSGQCGAITIEYAFMLMLGILPLLLLTINGTLVFSAKQSLSIAAADGARAALRHGTTAQKKNYACGAAREAMTWLMTFSKQSVNCSNPASPPIVVSNPTPCAGGVPGHCMKVEVMYDIASHPFMPGLGPVYGWFFQKPLRSEATVHLDPSFLPSTP